MRGSRQRIDTAPPPHWAGSARRSFSEGPCLRPPPSLDHDLYPVLGLAGLQSQVRLPLTLEVALLGGDPFG